MDELDQSEQSHVMGLYHRRLVLSDPVSMFICCLFDQFGAPWEGKTHALKAALIEATEIWGRLMGDGVHVSSRVRIRGPTQDEGALLLPFQETS